MLSQDEKLAAIKKLYEFLPPLECKGLCAGSCTDIDMSEVERDHIKRRHGISIKSRSLNLIAAQGGKKCKALKNDNTCRIYEDRPLVCRAVGVIDAAPCKFGCTPTRYLTDEEYKGLELAVEQLGGHWFRNDTDRAAQLKFYATPEGKAALKEQMDSAREQFSRLEATGAEVGRSNV